MTFHELVRKNRSIRGYDESVRVTKEELLELVDCARLSASSANLQTLKYYIAWEKEETEHILSLTGWAKALPQAHLPHDGMHPAAFIIICHDTDIAPSAAGFQKDVGIAAQSITLAATEKGLGGLMIGNFQMQKVKEEIVKADHLEPQLIIAIGKPAETVILTDVLEDGKTNYYRDAQDTHYVPKRKLDDVTVFAEK